MNNAIKSFIEDNKELIQIGDFEQFYRLTIYEDYSNIIVFELTNVLLTAGLDPEAGRKKVLVDVVNEALSEASNTQASIQTELFYYPNLLGYSTSAVMRVVEEQAAVLGYKLTPVDDTVFLGCNNYRVR